MIKKEMLKKIEELERQIEELKKESSNPEPEVGYKDDKLFLLSIDEYEKYKDLIPNFSHWWLRSPGHPSTYAAGVFYDGSVDTYSINVRNDNATIRPALKIQHNLEIEEKLYTLGYTWIVIDKDLALCETAIAMRRFDKKSNDYETSEIRQFLLDWYDERSKPELISNEEE